MSELRQLYEEGIRRYNAGDVDGFVALHAEDAELVTPVGAFHGRDAISGYWTYQRAAYPDLELTLDMVIEEGELLAAEWTFTGTNTGPTVARDGTTRVPTGRPVRLRGMELIRVARAAITEYRIYWDGLAIAQQLDATT